MRERRTRLTYSAVRLLANISICEYQPFKTDKRNGTTKKCIYNDLVDHLLVYTLTDSLLVVNSSK